MSVHVTRPGFEPRQAEPESAVLPLYYRAINGGRSYQYLGKKSIPASYSPAKKTLLR